MHEIITLIAKYAIGILVFAYLLLTYYERKGIKRLLLYTLISAVIAIVLIEIATTVHSDPRPFVRDGVKPYFSSATDNGFPSDHTALSSVIAAIIFGYKKVAGVLLVLLALIIGAARVIGGVHHGQDVVGAFVIAIIAVYFAYVLTNLITTRFKQLF